MASEGLRQLAENGNTRMLESELKAKSDHIRTIIKARGISYPNITGKTFAVFRVDSRHHLMSLVSMIDPSPDWIVGVSSLELCLSNCSWVESRTLNLYPWDAGTDDGVSYISPRRPSAPRHPIRRLRGTDPRSPFYQASPLRPFARLHLSRQRLYEKPCEPAAPDQTIGGLCETDEWSPWSPCSSTCGRGVKYKQRRYKMEDSKYRCHVKLTERANCEAVQKYCPVKVIKQEEDPLCELGPWGEWSSCSVSCGKGTKTRDRKYKNRLAAKRCHAGMRDPPKIQENLDCIGEGKCDDEDEDDYQTSVVCRMKPWSQWSPCSASCGKGYKERYRLPLRILERKGSNVMPFYKKYMELYDDEEELDESDPCSGVRMRETVECVETVCNEEFVHKNDAACRLPRDTGSCKSNVDRWYFDNIKGECQIFSYSGCDGNINNFKTLEHCQNVCKDYRTNRTNLQNHIKNNQTVRPVDCKVSAWSDWTSCNVTIGCGHGYMFKRRTVEVPAQHGGHPCPRKLWKKRRCHVECPEPRGGMDFISPADLDYNHVRVDCVVSEWGPWSSCAGSCRAPVYQTRRRSILVPSTPHGAPCPPTVQERLCVCQKR